nr:glycine betaine ABC transporter substrate-binding protein [Variovorax ginsengisoli]
MPHPAWRTARHRRMPVNVALFLSLGALALLGLWALPAQAKAQEDTQLRVGSKRFTESYILAEVIAQTAAPHLKEPPQLRQGLGNTAIVYEALRAGSIDVYAEYTGTIAQEILKRPAEGDVLTPAAMNAALAPLGLGVAVPLGFNDGYALAMRAADADRLQVRTLSDLARHRELKLGLSNEFIGRADGWKGLAARYGFGQTPTGLDHGLAYDALASRQIDVIDIYTTDAKIDHLGLRVLVDDRQYFPRYDAVLLYRLDLPQRLPPVWSALQKLEGRIDERAMIAMNARAELQGAGFDTIARDFLAGHTSDAPAASPVGARGFMAKLMGPDLGRLARQHLLLVVASVGLAILMAVPVGIAVFAHARWRTTVLGITGLLQTIPSLALLAVLISALGAIGTLPALIALTLYALLPIMRNTVTGLAEVPHGMQQAGMALGMGRMQNLRLVLLPLALPTLLAGVRTAATIAIGTATIAAFIGAGGFGERIVTGLALNDRALLVAGAVPAAAMAVLSELFFEVLGYLLVRRQARQRAVQE